MTARKTLIALVTLFVFTLGGLFAASAHEVRPVYLEATESTPGIWDITWKQPIKDGARLKIDPVLPSECTPEKERRTVTGATIITRWQTACDLGDAQISILGLDRTLTDAFVRVRKLDGEDISSVLRADAPTLDISTAKAAPVADYVRIGVEHIIFGFDHLLFVLGLFLLVQTRKLFLTVTAFTVAHSITLGLSALAGISLPGAPVEIVIALSIILLGAEAVHLLRGKTSISARFPWVIAFGFGLIHGFGFAGALAEIGLPKGAEIMALLLFNVGVEVGQVLFLIALLCLKWLMTRLLESSVRPAQLILSYTIGIAGSYWVIERLVSTFA
jgi:hypothetical protein